MTSKSKNLYGLVLSGGKSSRMGKDKGEIIYSPHLINQRERCHELLSPVCEKVFISIHESQKSIINSNREMIVDSVSGAGPGVGILSANAAHPGHAWLILACDFPGLEPADLHHLVNLRDENFAATYFMHADETPEPFLTIWEPSALQKLSKNFELGFFSPAKTLLELDAKKIEPLSWARLENVNY